jgi:hypothetical protein
MNRTTFQRNEISGGDIIAVFQQQRKLFTSNSGIRSFNILQAPYHDSQVRSLGMETKTILGLTNRDNDISDIFESYQHFKIEFDITLKTDF